MGPNQGKLLISLKKKTTTKFHQDKIFSFDYVQRIKTKTKK